MKRIVMTLSAFLAPVLLVWALAYISGAELFTGEAGVWAVIGTVLGVGYAFHVWGEIPPTQGDKVTFASNRIIFNGRQNGTVKWFNDAKGFGFITPESGEDLMVHFRSIEGTGFKSLKEGQAVTFVAMMGKHGLQADSVRLQEQFS
jgi:cold shock protein